METGVRTRQMEEAGGLSGGCAMFIEHQGSQCGQRVNQQKQEAELERTSPWEALHHGSFTLSKIKSFKKILDVVRVQSEML